MRRRTVRIETSNPEPGALRVRLEHRQVLRHSSLDYVIAIALLFGVSGFLIAMVGGPDSFFFILWAGGLFALGGGIPATPLIRKLRQRFARRLSIELAIDPGSHRERPSLRLGRREIAASEVGAVALMSWHDATAEARLWDVMLLLDDGGLDVVSGYHAETPARDLAEVLAKALHVDLKESSTAAGGASRR